MALGGQQSSRAPGEEPQVAGASTGPAAEAVPSNSWLVLVYRIQSEPTRLRAAVWRRLKTLGAMYGDVDLRNAIDREDLASFQ